MIFILFNLVDWLLVKLRTATCVSRRTFFATLFWKINLLFSFSDFEQNFCENFSEILSANFFTRTEFYVYRRTNWEENSYGGLRYHSFFPDFERWVNVTSGKKGFGEPVKSASYASRETFWKKTTLWKLSYKWLVSEIEGKPCGTIFKLFLRVQWNSVRKLHFMGKIKNIIVSTHYVKLYRNFKR